MAANSQKQRGEGRPFPKGKSGNPTGRPKVVGHVRDLARQYTEQAVMTLAKIMADDDAPHAAKVSASQALLDRGWGKPSQPVEGADGQPLFPSIIKIELVG